MQTTTWYDTFLRLNSTAVAMPTWKKYCSALNKLSLCCETTNQQLQWPLSEQLLCGFTLWALRSQGLSVDTIKSYIHGLSHLQKLHGFPGGIHNEIPHPPISPYRSATRKDPQGEGADTPPNHISQILPFARRANGNQTD
jgi:hypothetical protein